MLGHNFYWASIRKITAGFGTLFDNIYVTRYPLPGAQGTAIKSIKVPFAYSPGQKWLLHKHQDIEPQSKPRVKISYPRIGFELTSMSYDATRKLPTMQAVYNPTNTSPDSFIKQLVPVPYDIGYTVYIGAKNIDDGLQIIEQILPYFTPSFNVTIEDIPQMNITRDVPVIFNGIEYEDNYDGDFEVERVLMWTLSFTAKGYIYPPVTDANIIKKVIATLYPDIDMSLDPLESIVTEVNPITANYDDVDSSGDPTWDIKTTVTDQYDSNGDPIT